MGRTVGPYSRNIQSLADERFGDFRRGLARKHQEAFDDIMRTAKGHLAAGVMASNPYSIETILLSSLIEVKTTLNDMDKKFAKLEADIASIRARGIDHADLDQTSTDSC
ncbi:hypothetical protein [Leptospira sp. GIMC2001]|uniref:hypothetical protein n=1 Tax=Leptospira sp. GIMC2001 TaxID=1513297 RepID=UPI00234B85A6|nr:hypothetical protein [Leptospira sp. GIMC2001]WCL50451.1 hypothetical protein O4O04_06420 [Leptospira sp. GIMC2001]